MRNLPGNFRAHLEGETITLCNCWRMTRGDNSVLGFTDHDRDLEFDGLLYEAASGFEASQIESATGLTPDNHEILGALQSDRISSDDIEARRYDNARVQHFIVNWSDVSERALMATYLIGEITRNDGVFRAELKSLAAVLDQTNMRRFERRCSASLGDAKCRVDLDGNYLAQGIVTAIVKPDLIRVSGLNQFEANWFSGGRVEFLTGMNQGRKIEVTDFSLQAGGQSYALVGLWSALPDPLEVGDAFHIWPGCDKFFHTCRSRFSNGHNFRGFPHIPGTDFAMSYANNSEEMDGGALVP